MPLHDRNPACGTLQAIGLAGYEDAFVTTNWARLIRTKMPTKLTPHEVARSFRHDRRPFALIGRWAGGGAIIGSDPIRVANEDDDPFRVITEVPEVEDAVEGSVGGGWVGYLGYGLGTRIERLPPSPRRCVPMPAFSLAFYDHLLHYDQESGTWWFEALWTHRRAGTLARRLDLFRARLSDPAGSSQRFEVNDFVVVPSPEEHSRAVRRCIDYILEGDVFQTNLCIRLEARFGGDPLDLFLHGAGELEPAYGGFVTGPWGAVASFSPELFLERTSRRIRSAPIKGTAPRSALGGASEQRRTLLESAKDRAENVMIVDLMRNDFGRVCVPGSIGVPSLAQAEAHPGVWHLVSDVTGELKDGVDDAALLRATFPPGSVTGAPKIRAMEIISELETTAREAYTGSLGYVSPVAGLELNVAIRTFEFAGGRIWLGVGGGIVADSNPHLELVECFTKATPLVRVVGGSLEINLDDTWSHGGHRASKPPERPDPQLGVFETLLVIEGVAVELDSHLERMECTVTTLYDRCLPTELQVAATEAARSSGGMGRLRVSVWPPGDGRLEWDIEMEAVDPHLIEAPTGSGTELVVDDVCGSLGAHKWRDRRVLTDARRRHRLSSSEEILLVDRNSEVLEAGHGNVFALIGATLVTPVTDGRLLPGVTRARILSLARDQSIFTTTDVMTLDTLSQADEVFLTSSVRGVEPVIACHGVGRWGVGPVTLGLRRALLQQWLEMAAPVPDSQVASLPVEGGREVNP